MNIFHSPQKRNQPINVTFTDRLSVLLHRDFVKIISPTITYNSQIGLQKKQQVITLTPHFVLHMKANSLHPSEVDKENYI